MRKFQVGALCKVVSNHLVGATGIDVDKPVIVLHGIKRGNTMLYAVSYAVLGENFRCVGFVSCKDLKQVGHYKGKYDRDERAAINAWRSLDER